MTLLPPPPPPSTGTAFTMGVSGLGAASSPPRTARGLALAILIARSHLLTLAEAVKGSVKRGRGASKEPLCSRFSHSSFLRAGPRGEMERTLRQVSRSPAQTILEPATATLAPSFSFRNQLLPPMPEGTGAPKCGLAQLQ